jgi:stage II sporulation protein M
MVLESLINPFSAEKRPWEMFFVGFLYNSVALFLSWWIFPEQASLTMVFLTVLACVPLIYNTIKMEEKYDMDVDEEYLLIKEHGRVLSFLMFLFLGIMLSVTLWYVILPTSFHSNLFSIQAKTIETINYQITGNVINGMQPFIKIFLNNLKVLMFCLLFAFFYCFGSIFILTWNASVIGVAIGNFIRINLSKYSGYFAVVHLAIFRYMTHGVFEILSYFVAGLAGGIISIAVTNHDFGTKKFQHVLLDSIDLILLSVLLLLVAALVEVFVTPLLF